MASSTAEIRAGLYLEDRCHQLTRVFSQPSSAEWYIYKLLPILVRAQINGSFRQSEPRNLKTEVLHFPITFCNFCQNDGSRVWCAAPCPPPSLPAGPGDADLSPGIIVIIIIICPTDTPKWPESGLILWQPPILFNGKIFAKVKIYVKPSGADRVIWSQIITQENIFATVKNYLGIRPEMVKLFHATKQYVSGCFSIGDTYAAISN